MSALINFLNQIKGRKDIDYSKILFYIRLYIYLSNTFTQRYDIIMYENS